MVLFPKEDDLFHELSKVGQRLRAIHNSASESFLNIEVTNIRLAGRGEARVQKGFPKFDNGKIKINENRWFEEVSKDTWNYYFGGYQVCHKWLKDRAGKGGKNPRPGFILSDEDILHYRRTVTALTKTLHIMPEIDRLIAKHGGWPDAFVASNEAEGDD